MNDWMAINIPLKEKALRDKLISEEFPSVNYKPLNKLGLRTSAKDVYWIDEIQHCKITDLTHPWESVPSCFSGMAIKIVDSTKFAPAYLCIKGSPAKLTQGHNAYGTEDLEFCAMALLVLLEKAYPTISSLLDIENAELSRMDITRSSRLGSLHQVMAVLNYLRPISNRQTKKSDGYDTSLYFGSGASTRKHLCVYSKEKEIEVDLKQAIRRGQDQKAKILKSALEFSRNLIRFEARIKKDLIIEIFGTKKMKDVIAQCKENPDLLDVMFQRGWKDIFDSFENQDDIRCDEEVRTRLFDLAEVDASVAGKKLTKAKARNVYNTYVRILHDGFDKALHPDSMSSSTKYEHLAVMKAIGLSRAYLQQQDGETQSNVVPIIRLIDIAPADLKPAGYEVPDLREIFAA